MLRRQHYCALCGTEENLTTHHVGGGEMSILRCYAMNVTKLMNDGTKKGEKQDVYERLVQGWISKV